MALVTFSNPDYKDKTVYAVAGSHTETVLKLANEGQLPATKVASQWRFMRRLLDEWLETQMQMQTGPFVRDVDEFTQNQFLVRDLVEAKLVKPRLSALTKSEAVAEMARIPVEAGRITHRGNIFLKALLERERLCSTGLGRGFAFLHPRRALVNLVDQPLVAVGRSGTGIDFEALDGKPTHIFFLVCAPNDSVHLRVMAALARLGSRPGLLADLCRASGAKGICGVLSSAEASETRIES